MYKFIVIFCILSNSLFARDVQKSLKQRMQSFSSNMEQMLPLAFSNKKLTKEQAKNLKKTVEKLSKDIKGLEGHFSFHDNRTPFIGKMLKEHVSELHESVKTHSIEYSKSMIKSIPRLCVQCHVQDRIKTVKINKLKQKDFSSKLEFAEYLSMIRNFNEASKIYDSIIWNKKESFVNKNDALEGQLAIHIRIFNSPAKAIKKFTSYENLLKDKKVLNRISEIRTELMSYAKKSEFNYLNITDKSIIKEAVKFEKNLGDADSYLMDDKDYVKSLVFLSNLYDYINEDEKNKNVPVGLYWISILERKLQQSLFYSLGDLYMKKCIKSFPKHPYAKKCFKKYKQNQMDAFTGSRGTDLPDSVKADLDSLEKSIK